MELVNKLVKQFVSYSGLDCLEVSLLNMINNVISDECRLISEIGYEFIYEVMERMVGKEQMIKSVYQGIMLIQKVMIYGEYSLIFKIIRGNWDGMLLERVVQFQDVDLVDSMFYLIEMQFYHIDQFSESSGKYLEQLQENIYFCQIFEQFPEYINGCDWNFIQRIEN